MKKVFFYLTPFLLLFTFIIFNTNSNIKEDKFIKKYHLDQNLFNSEYSYIAHAGGGINGQTYTNSKEAVLNSIKNNFKLIELDLLNTIDDRIIAYHDWNSLSELCSLDRKIIETLNFSEIKKCDYSINGKSYTFMDDILINQIFSENKELILVTDKITDISLIKKKFVFQDRIIIETWGILNYLRAKFYNIGIPMYNFTVGRRNDWYVKLFNIKIIATSADNIIRYENLFAKYIKEGKIIFAYSSNDKKFNKEHLGFNASAVYTDFWNIKNGECTMQEIRPDVCQIY